MSEKLSSTKKVKAETSTCVQQAAGNSELEPPPRESLLTFLKVTEERVIGNSIPDLDNIE